MVEVPVMLACTAEDDTAPGAVPWYTLYEAALESAVQVNVAVWPDKLALSPEGAGDDTNEATRAEALMLPKPLATSKPRRRRRTGRR